VIVQDDGRLRMAFTHHGRTVHVVAEGALDTRSYPALRDGLLKTGADGPDAVIVQIDGLEFARQELLSVFALAARRIMDWPGAPLMLVSGRADHRRRLATNAIDRFVPVYGTVAEAEGSVDARPRRRIERLLVREPAASRYAREFTRATCARWSVGELAEDATLIVEELLSNAVRHTTSVPRLRLELRRGMLTVAISDDSPRLAVMRERRRPTEPGLGLLLVAQTARAWGCTRTWSGGKVVWAVLTTTSGRLPKIR